MVSLRIVVVAKIKTLTAVLRRGVVVDDRSRIEQYSLTEGGYPEANVSLLSESRSRKPSTETSEVSEDFSLE